MNIIITLIMFLLLPVFQSEAGELINKQLPQWINVDLQLRHRYEYRSDFDFNDNVDDKDGFNLWRSRVGLTLKPTKDLKLFYQFQDARISHDKTSGLKAVSGNWAETRQLWVEAKTSRLAVDAMSLSKVGMRFGRQELAYGAQRLLGAFDWSNQAQTFDAGKLIFEFEKQKMNIDIFAGGKTPVKTPREQDGFYDGAANDIIGGYYAEYKGITGLTIEQYMISRNTDGKTVSFGQTGDGEVEDYTIGGRVLGKIPNTAFDFELEAAKQSGNSGRLDVDAQMVVAIVGYTFDHAWKPRVSFEFDYASGDDNRTDVKRQTFDNLQPTNHLFYGYMDFVSLQNINNYRFQIKADPHKKLNVQSDLHMIFLDTAKDNLYAANRAVKRSTTAGADAFVGDELDFLLKYQFTKEVSTMVGYSHF
ncbi:MAG: alginate export family protein, partial [Candidatus Omnitrophica bacterium]|nr:alginate export family protein [Candidatus Omnitrophota bacterium]